LPSRLKLIVSVAVALFEVVDRCYLRLDAIALLHLDPVHVTLIERQRRTSCEAVISVG
jgi:hypothetical protein